MHFDPEHPENHNMYISDTKNVNAQKYNGEAWVIINKHEFVNNVLNDKIIYIEQNLKNHEGALIKANKKSKVTGLENLSTLDDTDPNCAKIIKKLKQDLCKIDTEITGFNIGINAGHDAGQTVDHCHIHLIPRRKNDVENPRGGIRHVIPDKGNYESIIAPRI